MFHNKRTTTRGLSSLLLLIVMLAGGVPGSRIANAQQAVRLFPETSKSVSGRFLQYWDTHGGLAQQGFPISGAMGEPSATDGKVRTVQYFERAVFEYHPENQPPNDVLLSLLGAFRYQQKYPTGGAPGQVSNTSTGSVLFKETGKRVGGAFLAYWQQHGGLAQQGYPISGEFSEKSDLDGQTYAVQYFERAVFEYHPEIQATDKVLLSQLGAFRYKQLSSAGRGVAPPLPVPPAIPIPTATPQAKATATPQARATATPNATANPHRKFVPPATATPGHDPQAYEWASQILLSIDEWPQFPDGGKYPATTPWPVGSTDKALYVVHELYRLAQTIEYDPRYRPPSCVTSEGVRFNCYGYRDLRIRDIADYFIQNTTTCINGGDYGNPATLRFNNLPECEAVLSDVQSEALAVQAENQP
jgi:hypothetical protein